MEHSARHTVLFTAVLCVVFSLLVSAVSVGLHDRQEENRRLDRMRKVLAVAGLVRPGERPSREDLARRFDAHLEPRLVDLETGRYVEGIDPMGFDQREEATDPSQSRPAPENPAKVRRLPRRALIFLIVERGETEGVILPIEGYGLWSTMYGYLALEADARTIRGITFYEHGETAGLGGEVDSPRWRALWPGRLAFDAAGELKIRVAKGPAGPPERDPYRVDGISGATLTSNGVTHMLKFWLGEHGFERYLAEYRRKRRIG